MAVAICCCVLQGSVVQRLQRFATYSHLKQVVLRMITEEMRSRGKAPSFGRRCSCVRSTTGSQYYLWRCGMEGGGGGGSTAFALKLSVPTFRVPCRCACMTVADIFSYVAAACDYLPTPAYLLAAYWPLCGCCPVCVGPVCRVRQGQERHYQF